MCRPWKDSKVDPLDVLTFVGNLIGMFMGAVQYSGDNMVSMSTARESGSAPARAGDPSGPSFGTEGTFGFDFGTEAEAKAKVKAEVEALQNVPREQRSENLRCSHGSIF